MTMFIYSLEDINQIAWNTKYFTISEESNELIVNLSKQVCDPNYIRTPVFEKNSSSKRNHHYNKKGSNIELNKVKTDEQWEAIRNFKATTTISKDISDKQKNINNIRLLINKLSNKNFNSIFNDLVEILDNADDKDIDEYYIQINELIFNNAGTNKVLAEVYAHLYKELMNKYETIKNILHEKFNQFVSLFNNIEFVHPNVDYDKFCDINIINEKRRAISLFICNLLKNEMLKGDDIIHIIFQLQNLLFTNIEKENFVEQNSEISENLFILITNSNIVLKKHTEWKSIINNVDMIKKMKAIEKPSLSNKIIFKHMDIMDHHNKN